MSVLFILCLLLLTMLLLLLPSDQALSLFPTCKQAVQSPIAYSKLVPILLECLRNLPTLWVQ
jgi:hypothetical protein